MTKRVKAKGQDRPYGAISRHSRVAEIEIDFAKGVACATIAKKYSTESEPLSHWQCIRYRRDLLRRRPTALQALKATAWDVTPAEFEQLRLQTSRGWLAQARSQMAKMLRVQDNAIEASDQRLALAAAGRVAQLLQMIGESVRELGAVGTVNLSLTQNNLIMNPQYHRMRTALLSCLQKHPEARSDVLAALSSIEDETADGDADSAPLKLINGADSHG
jgi:hypothetical protein